LTTFHQLFQKVTAQIQIWITFLTTKSNIFVAKKCVMPLSTSFDNSLDENNSCLESKYPQGTRFRLGTTRWKISDKDLTDASPSNVNINLEQKFGNVKNSHHKISGEKLVFRCEDCKQGF
jgi:hypothetical protein